MPSGKLFTYIHCIDVPSSFTTSQCVTAEQDGTEENQLIVPVPYLLLDDRGMRMTEWLGDRTHDPMM